MTEMCCFLIGCLVVEIITRHKINKLMERLSKVSSTGDEMWKLGVKYAMDQIRKW